MNTSMLIHSQLLATKFFLPVIPENIIARPRLSALLAQGLKYPLTLVSAPAGFGKTTSLSAWAQSLPASHPLVAWVSLDEEDNEPRLFWSYVLTALNRQHPERFKPLLVLLQSQQASPLNYILTVLINQLADNAQQFLLILDDYHAIMEQQIHTSLSYLVEHLPAQLRIILATRADPPLRLSSLQAHQQVLKVCTDQLRYTVEETRAFFHEVMGIEFPDEKIQHVTACTEGWPVALQLLALFQQAGANPATLLEQATGDQRYILDYLTEEILQQQPQEVQTFLLSTCILERLTASLCDAVLEQTGSQHILERLEQANVFVMSLDNKREWYRYHALFAQALHYQLKLSHPDLLPTLHHRASLWYAQHDQTTQAILHALHAHQWLWAAHLIERLPVMSFTWGASEQELVMLWQWVQQLPEEIMHSRPRLCLACAQIFWTIVPYSTLQGWFEAAETKLTASLFMQSNQDSSSMLLDSQERQEQKNLLGEVFSYHALLQSYQQDGQAALSLCQRALSLLSPENYTAHVQIAVSHLNSTYSSSINDAVTAIQSGLQAASLAQATGQTVLAINTMSFTAMYMMGAGTLHEAQRLSQQATLLGKRSGELLLPQRACLALFQAEILREWNELDTARSLAEEAVSQCQQVAPIASIKYVFYGYAILLRISLSRGDLDAARSAFQQIERISIGMNQFTSSYYRSLFTTMDQVRLWLAGGELDRAMRWVQELDLRKRYSTPFAIEREEVAHVRVLLALSQPDLALQRLSPVLQRAIAGQRWGHVIEMRLLQALAHQMLHEIPQALCALAEAVRLAEPEGYLRCFVDEGISMAVLLSKLQKGQHEHTSTLYLNRVLAAFPQQGKTPECQIKQVAAQPLQDPLSERELEVLQLLIHGASNQAIAQELGIALDTVKHHISHIFAKLEVKNRVQAMEKARALNLLGEGC